MSGCAPTWTSQNDTNMPYGMLSAADTVEDCRNACNFNATCIAVDWVGSAASGLRCWRHMSGGTSTSSSPGTEHHSITRKCGQQFHCFSFKDFWRHGRPQDFYRGGPWGGLKDGSPPAESRGSFLVEFWGQNPQKLTTFLKMMHKHHVYWGFRQHLQQKKTLFNISRGSASALFNY